MHAPRVALISLGCPKNLVDSEKVLARVGERGAAMCARAEDADVIVVNTCGFIRDAQEESLRILRQAAILRREGQCKRLIAMGCLAERWGSRLRRLVPEIDNVVGLRERAVVETLCCPEPDAPAAVPAEGDFVRLRLTPRHFAYLRIAEGCDNRCAYCAIPDIRGPFHSRPLEHVLAEARHLANDGAVELDLVAQDTTRYGEDIYGRRRLPDLLNAVSNVRGVKWVRLLYTHPAHFDGDLVRAVAQNDRVCRYIDLPVQHLDDEILMRMNRCVSRGDILRLIESLRAAMPDVVIRSAVIVGFPGETDSHFRTLLDGLQRIEFDRLGAFVYSQEEGTPAASMDGQVSEKTKMARLDEVMRLQQQIAFRKNRLMIGRELQVLIDERADGEWIGRSHGEAPEVDGVIYVHGDGLAPGRFVRVRIVDTRG